MNLLIVTPAFGDDGTGAGSYYAALVSRLTMGEYSVHVVCHREVNSDLGDRTELRAFLPNLPKLGRSACSKCRAWYVRGVGDWRREKYRHKSNFQCLIIHDSVLTKSLIALPLLRLVGPPASRRIVDVRAPIKGSKERVIIRLFGGKIIACSRNTLASLGPRVRRTSLIPIPLDAVHGNLPGARLVLDEKRVHPDARLVLYAGRLKRSKGVPKLIEAFLLADFDRETLLILAGADKLSRSERRLLRSPRVVHLGIQPRDVTRGIMTLSSLVVNLSPEEGLSRSMLEAMSLDRPVLLPPNTPEFNDTDPALVVDKEVGIKDLSLRIQTALEEELRAKYDLGPHNLDRVVDRTVAFIESV